MKANSATATADGMMVGPQPAYLRGTKVRDLGHPSQ
jgi:hypothetical protein